MEMLFEGAQNKDENYEPELPTPLGQTPLPIYAPQDPASRFANYFANFVAKLRRRSETVVFSSAWNSEGFAFATATTVVINLLILIAGIMFFNDLPPQVRFFYNAATGQGILVEKTLTLICPVLILMLESIVLRLNWEIYKLDVRLANVISWVMTLLNLVTAIAAVQLFSIALGI